MCTCFNVTDAAIASTLAELDAAAGADALLQSEAERLSALQAKLACGTNCGSCVPELKRRVRAARAAEAPVARPVIPIRQIA